MMNLEVRTPMPAATMAIPEGDAGTAATIQQMARLIDQGMKDPVVHELAARLVRGVRQFDFTGEARSIYEGVRRNVRFTRDIRGKETLHAAPEIIRLRIGDCDDFTILMCALLGSVGHKCRIVTISAYPAAPDIFSHVYPEVFLDGRWVAVDAARKDPAFGKSPERFIRKRVWSIETGEYRDVQALNGFGIHTSPNSTALHRAIPAGLALRARRQQILMVRRSAALQGMGIDWSAITDAISAGSAGAANIITAERASPFNLVPTTSVGQPQRSAAVPYNYPLNATAGSFSMSPTAMMLIGLGLVAVIMMGRR